MKRQLLSVVTVLTSGLVLAQPSPSWNILQNTNFPLTSAGTRFLDVVDPNVVWTIGYNGGAVSQNWNWFSKTTNGGSNFTTGFIYKNGNGTQDTNTKVIANMEGIDANTAWVSAYYKGPSNPTGSGQPGGGAVHRTTDGGLNWYNMTQPNMYIQPGAFLNIVSFFNASVGIAMGDPVNGSFEIWR